MFETISLLSLSNWFGWIVGGGVSLGLILLVAVIFGLAPVLNVVGKVLEGALEIAKPIAAAVVAGTIYFVSQVLWPGLKDILDDWVTIVTVIFAGFLLWSFLSTQQVLMKAEMTKNTNIIQQRLATTNTSLLAARKELTSCKVEVQKLSRKANKLFQ